MLDAYGAIPADGSRFEVDVEGMHVKVLNMKDHRVETAVVTILPKEE